MGGCVRNIINYCILSIGTKLEGSFRYSSIPSLIMAISSAVKSVSIVYSGSESTDKSGFNA